jgi:hypothetical protein
MGIARFHGYLMPLATSDNHQVGRGRGQSTCAGFARQFERLMPDVTIDRKRANHGLQIPKRPMFLTAPRPVP